MAKSIDSANPFEFGRAMRADSIVDREEELRRLTAAVHNGERLFLIGPRRYGKTSLLNYMQSELGGHGVIVLKYDVEKYETTRLLAKALLSGAIRTLTGPVDKVSALAGRQIKRFFGSLKPELTYDVAEETWSVSVLGDRRSEAASLPVLTEVLDGIEAMAASRKRTVVVVLDEFQQLVAEGGVTAERQIRASVQTHQHVSYIFAGSKTRLLTDMTTHHARPFYRMGSSLFLGPIARAAFAPFLTEGFEARGFKVAPGAIERILDLAEDVPYSVQRLAHRCWDLLAGTTTPARTLTSVFVESAVQRIALEDDPAYTQLWLSLTTVQKKALRAVIGTSGRLLLSKGVNDQYDLAVASMQKALKALTARGIVREEQTLGDMRLRLDDPFLATWLKSARTA